MCNVQINYPNIFTFNLWQPICYLKKNAIQLLGFV